MTSVPSNLTTGKKRVIAQYLIITESGGKAGSALYREIAKNLFMGIDQNNSNSYVRQVIQEFLDG